ncbi:serine/threonine-protein kinase [Paractinoplanes atraurantiacus]|uniref:non-specific serine/threonine protein kinase n=1 Tax=Paractinoplanes atraurantiacus TaxID=1036182 RepID=A0A285IXL5_9ACTN|nr:serine/threonine-protein kinase [Actinoplanes atraurantiacus]SNY52722.1 Serine/threonine protein kinase [Actinoplanes atraurantiacus]
MPQFSGRDGGEWEYDDANGSEGGMGAVFHGKSLVDGSRVAVKRVRLKWASTRAERVREREIEVGDRLTEAARSGDSTGHLVLPLDIAFAGGDLLIVMPLADGSLADDLTDGPLALDAGLTVLRQVAEGLVELAAVSIAHRDLKPGNVLRFGDTWKISDFGLSRILTEVTGTYTTGGGGTLPYMAPEVWTDHRGTAKSDLYALGVLAYEVFTGERPFPGPSEDDYERQHLTAAPPNTPGLPPRLSRLLARLVAKAPADRPQDARAVIEAVDNLRQKLTPAQEGLVEDVRRREDSRRDRDIAANAKVTAEERRKQERRQAVADLAAILEDAFDEIVEALPDARLDAGTCEITVSGLRVRFQTLNPLELSGPGSTVLTAAAMSYAPGEQPLPYEKRKSSAHAMFTCRRVDDRLRWTVQTWPLYESGPERPLDSAAVIDVLRAALHK